MRVKWTLEKLKEEALKYDMGTDFAKYSNGAYQSAYRKGILDEICSHMKDRRINWTVELIQLEANKYTVISDFRKYSFRAYSTAHNRKIIDMVCTHMKDAYTYWTVETIQIEANKYAKRSEFKIGNPTCYYAAKRRKILDLVCLHMKNSGTSSLLEKELFGLIKTFYPSVKKITDRKVMIRDKPHIHGFDIDIFIPELNRGIEFDGEYWHSFKFMRKQKRRENWPDGDIFHYHEIKDGYFLSKGIQILHVKEEDWIENKQACIDKCLEFLSI